MMDNIPFFCYTFFMNEFTEKQWKKDGFRGEQMIVLPTESFGEYVNHPQVRRLYVTDVGFFPRAKYHYRERKDGIEEYIFIYCTEGKGVVEVKGKEYLLHANEAFCIPRWTGHRYYADEKEPWSILWMHCKGEETKYFPLERCEIIRFVSKNATNRMHFLFDLLFRVLAGNYTLGNFIYISQVASLILAEAYDREKGDTVQKQNKHVTNVIRYMYAHLEENLNLDDLVKAFGFSKSYLNALFQNYTQHAPMEFFIIQKMKRACELLRSTELHVYEIAQKLGYTDPYYFSRIFKKVVGMAPKEYKHSEYFYYEE